MFQNILIVFYQRLLFVNLQLIFFPLFLLPAPCIALPAQDTFFFYPFPTGALSIHYPNLNLNNV